MNLKVIRGLLTLVLGLSVMMAPLPATATAFTTDLNISGNISYDNTSSDYYGDAYAGQLKAVANGPVIVLQPYTQASAGTSVTIAPGGFSEFGHGLGATANTSVADSEASVMEYFWGIDLGFNLSNTSTTETYQVTFKVDLDNSVSADLNDPDSTVFPDEDEDAFAHSEFFLEDSNGEVFFTDILSDPLNGNEIGGVLTGGFGGTVIDNGSFFFDIILDPLMDEMLLGFLTFDGLAYGGSSSIDFSTFVSIYGVENLTTPIPEPSTMVLLGFGLVGLGIMVHRRRKHSLT